MNRQRAESNPRWFKPPSKTQQGGRARKGRALLGASGWWHFSSALLEAWEHRGEPDGSQGQQEVEDVERWGVGGVGWGQPYPQVVLLLFSLYPVEGLLLRVDAEGEAAGPGGEDAVLNRELVGGQPLGAPPGRGSDRGGGDFSGRAVSRRGASEAGELGGQCSLPSLCRWVSRMPPGLCAPSSQPGVALTC